MQIGVVDYGVGNIANVMRCLEYVARTESIKRVSTHKDIQSCDKIVLPGVGAFGSAMEHLSARDLDKSLCEYAKSGRYMLGICLGMQLLFEKSYEFGEYKGLGLVEGFVAPFGSRESIEWYIKTNMESKELDSINSYPTPNNHSIRIESRFCENTPQSTALTQVSEKIEFSSCHIERSETSNMGYKKGFSLNAQNDKKLDSIPINHANKTTNSSSCSMALAELEDRGCLSDMTIHHNSVNHSNCIDKGANLENLESIYTNIQALYTTNSNKKQNTHLKIPHIGWNKNFIKKPHDLCASMKDSFYLYFVHSYHVCCDIRFIIAACDYGISFPSIINKDNILGIQPHPERSHEMGFKLMRDFLQLR